MQLPTARLAEARHGPPMSRLPPRALFCRPRSPMRSARASSSANTAAGVLERPPCHDTVHAGTHCGPRDRASAAGLRHARRMTRHAGRHGAMAVRWWGRVPCPALTAGGPAHVVPCATTPRRTAAAAARSFAGDEPASASPPPPTLRDSPPATPHCACLGRGSLPSKALTLGRGSTTEPKPGDEEHATRSHAHGKGGGLPPKWPASLVERHHVHVHMCGVLV